MKYYNKPVITLLPVNQTFNTASMQYITFDYATCVGDPNVPLLVYHLGSGEFQFCEYPDNPFEGLPTTSTIKCNETGDTEHSITAYSIKPGGNIDCASLGMVNVIIAVSIEDESALPEYCTVTSDITHDEIHGDDELCD